MDAKTGKILGDFKEIDKISHDYETLGNTGSLDFSVIFSPDKSKVAFLSNIKRIKSDSRVIKEMNLMVKLYDTKKFTKLWEKPMVNYYGNSLIAIKDYVLSNDGLFYTLFAFLKDQKHYSKRLGILMTGANSKNNQVYVLDNNSDSRVLYEDVVALKMIGNKLFCTGTFVDGETTQFLTSKAEVGFFLIVINAQTFGIDKQDFSYSKKYVETTSPDILTDLQTGPILQDEKGSYYCIKLKPSNSTWQYAQIGVCKYSKDFDLEWMRVIPKFSYSSSTYGAQNYKDEPLLGFSFLQYEDGLRFFYPEHKKNISKYPDITQNKLDKHTIVMSLKSAVFVCTTINSKGELHREPLSNTNQNVFFGEYGEEENLWIKKTGAILVKNHITEFKKSYSLFTYKKP